MERNVEEQLRSTLHCDDKEKLRRKLALLQREYLRTAQRLQRAERRDAVRQHVRSRITQQNQQDHRDSEVTADTSTISLNADDATDLFQQGHTEAADSGPFSKSQVIRFLLPSDAASSPQTPEPNHDLVRSHPSSSALRLRSRRSRLRWERRSAEEAGRVTDSGEDGCEQRDGTETEKTEEDEENIKCKETEVVNQSEELFSALESESSSLLLKHWSSQTETGHVERKETQGQEEERQTETELSADGEETGQDHTPQRDDDGREDEDMKLPEENSGKNIEGGKTENDSTTEIKEEKSLLDSCTLVEGLLFPVEYYVRTTRRMSSSQSQPDVQAVIQSQLNTRRQRRSRGRGGNTNTNMNKNKQPPVNSQTNADSVSPPASGATRPNTGRGRRRGRGRRTQSQRSYLSLDTSEPSDDPQTINTTLVSSAQCLSRDDEPASLLSAPADNPPDVPPHSTAAQPQCQQRVYPIFVKSNRTNTSRDTSDWRSLLLPSSPPVQAPLPSLTSIPFVNNLLNLDVHQDFHLPDDQFASLKLHKLRQVTVESGVEHFTSPLSTTRSSYRHRYDSKETLTSLPVPLSLTPTITHSQKTTESPAGVQETSNSHHREDETVQSMSPEQEVSERTAPPPTVAEEVKEHTASPPTVTDSEEVSECTALPPTVAEEVSECTAPPSTVTEEVNEHTTSPPTVTEEVSECTALPPTVAEEVSECTAPPSTVTEEVNEHTTSPPTVTEEVSECPAFPPTVAEEVSECTAPPSTVTEEVSEHTTSPPTVTDSEEVSECPAFPPAVTEGVSERTTTTSRTSVVSQLLLSPRGSVPSVFTPHPPSSALLSSPALPSLGLTPCLPLTSSPTLPALTLPPPHSPSTQALSPPALSPCLSITSLPTSQPPASPPDLNQVSSAHQGHTTEPTSCPVMSSSDHVFRSTHTLKAPAGGCLVDCCLVGPGGRLFVAAAGKWAVCLWSQTTESDWSLVHTWTFNDPVINVFPVPDAVDLMFVTLGQLEIREVRTLSSSSLVQMLLCRGIVQAVVGVSRSRVVISSHLSSGSSLQVFHVSDCLSSLSSQPLVSPGVSVRALAPVDGLCDALIGSDDAGHVFVWNMKTGQLLQRIVLSESLCHSSVLRGFSSRGVLFVLLQHQLLSSLEEEDEEEQKRRNMGLFSLVAINPLSCRSVLAARLNPPEAWTGRLCEADVSSVGVVGLSQSGCVCVWDLSGGGGDDISMMVPAPESDGWQLARWGEWGTLVTGHHNGDVTLHRYITSRTSLK